MGVWGVDTGRESRRFCPQGRKGSSETHCTWIGEGLKGSMGPSPWLGVSVVESLEHWLGKSIHPFRCSLKYSRPETSFTHSFSASLVAVLGPTCAGRWEQ